MIKKLAAVLLAASSLVACNPSPSHAETRVETFDYAGTRDADQTLDAYYNPATKGGRWIAVFHGGSWAAGSKANSARASKAFAAEGFQVFNVAYRLTTDYGPNLGAPWPAQRDDALLAVDWIRDHATKFGIDPDRGALYGFSAGGHIATSAGLLGKGALGVKAIVSASGVLQPHRVQDVADSDPASGHEGDFPTVDNRTLSRWEAVATGCPRLPAWTDCNNRWLDFMPETHISKTDPPMMLFQGTADPAVPSRTGRAFSYWLSRSGVTNTLVECKGWTHTEACAFDGGKRQAAMIAFLKARTA